MQFLFHHGDENSLMKRWFLGLGLLAAMATVLGFALHPLAVDDAFITYRYAHNLAAGNGFIYNPGRPVLSTTAPLWALILSGGALLWPDLPALANILSAAAVGAAAIFLFLLGRREVTPWAGLVSAMFLVTWPLLWLSLGLETAIFLALSLAAILTYQSERFFLSAILLALATLTRADGLVLTAVLTADYILRLFFTDTKHSDAERGSRQTKKAVSWRIILGSVALYVIVLLPLVGWLIWQFGSPLPATLAAKRAQAELGITGFYAHTTYLQGLIILLRARLAQTFLYLLFLPALAAGLVALFQNRKYSWARLLVAWGATHLIGYTILGVTPYYWYYAPLLPGVAAMAAVGVVWSVRRLHIGNVATWGVGVAWVGLLLAALLWSDGKMVQALEGPAPPPENPISKVLPEAKVDVYEQAGRWLNKHTPADALVGVTEVGIMGYYSQRPMIDFLGLLEPDVARALERGDLYWALLHYQPDYLALTAVSPLYAYNLRADPWFQAVYTPMRTFDDPRFWGSPLTIYKRQMPRMPLVESMSGELPSDALPLDADFGRQIRLVGAVTGNDTAHPGDILPLTLYWQAVARPERNYTVFVHLLGQQERVIAQRDTAPGLGASPTSSWKPGQAVADPYLIALPPAAYAPDKAVWEVGLYDATNGQRLPMADGRDSLRFGAVSILPSDKPLRLDFGPVALTGYELDRLALTPNEMLHVTLQWEGDGPANISIQLVSEQGDVATQVEGTINQSMFTLTLPDSASPGVYNLEVLATDPATGATLPLLGADAQPQSDRAQLTKIRLLP